MLFPTHGRNNISLIILPDYHIVSSDSHGHFFGCKITILPPNKDSLQKSKIQWQREEAKQPVAATMSDYKFLIAELSQIAVIEDNDPFNGGSIVFLMEYNETTFLLSEHERLTFGLPMEKKC